MNTCEAIIYEYLFTARAADFTTMTDAKLEVGAKQCYEELLVAMKNSTSNAGYIAGLEKALEFIPVTQMHETIAKFIKEELSKAKGDKG